MLGLSKPFNEVDIQALHHFSTEQCQNSLNQENIHSIQVINRNNNFKDNYIVFNVNQICPRYAIIPRPCSQTAIQRNVMQDIRSNNIHQLNYINDSNPSANSRFKCLDHPEKYIEFWSPSHKRMICSLCIYKNQDKYKDMVLLTEVNSNSVPRLNLWFDKALTYAKKIESDQAYYNDLLYSQ